ncbi:hypothetical protein J3F83DRAFT_734108 [Trichoderma novae-zelandiae]
MADACSPASPPTHDRVVSRLFLSAPIIEDFKDEIQETLQRLDDETSERIERVEDDVEGNTAGLVESMHEKEATKRQLAKQSRGLCDVTRCVS